MQGYDYQYDANGNPLPIYDLTLGDNSSRVMDYDAIDRLETVSSISFGGDMAYRYRYTALGNVFSATLGGVKDYANLIYRASINRLTSVTNFQRHIYGVVTQFVNDRVHLTRIEHLA